MIRLRPCLVGSRRLPTAEKRKQMVVHGYHLRLGTFLKSPLIARGGSDGKVNFAIIVIKGFGRQGGDSDGKGVECVVCVCYGCC